MHKTVCHETWSINALILTIQTIHTVHIVVDKLGFLRSQYTLHCAEVQVLLAITDYLGPRVICTDHACSIQYFSSPMQLFLNLHILVNQHRPKANKL